MDKSTFKIARGTSRLLSGMYFLGLIYFTFFYGRRATTDDFRIFINYMPLIKFLTFSGLDLKAQLYFLLDVLGNIILFMPFAFAISSIKQLPAKKIFAIGIFVTLCIEVTQLVFNIGVFDVDDILLNAAGAFLGILLLNYIQIV